MDVNFDIYNMKMLETRTDVIWTSDTSHFTHVATNAIKYSKYIRCTLTYAFSDIGFILFAFLLQQHIFFLYGLRIHLVT
jgi:hypothetical protein